MIADEGARPDVIAADLLAQCEHDPNAKAILLTTSEALATRTIEAVEEELKTLETAGIAARSWQDYGEVIVLSDFV